MLLLRYFTLFLLRLGSLSQKNEDFRSGSTSPFSAFEGSSSFFELEVPSFFIYFESVAAR